MGVHALFSFLEDMGVHALSDALLKEDMGVHALSTGEVK